MSSGREATNAYSKRHGRGIERYEQMSIHKNPRRYQVSTRQQPEHLVTSLAVKFRVDFCICPADQVPDEAGMN